MYLNSDGKETQLADFDFGKIIQTGLDITGVGTAAQGVVDDIAEGVGIEKGGAIDSILTTGANIGKEILLPGGSSGGSSPTAETPSSTGTQQWQTPTAGTPQQQWQQYAGASTTPTTSNTSDLAAFSKGIPPIAAGGAVGLTTFLITKKPVMSGIVGLLGMLTKIQLDRRI